MNANLIPLQVNGEPHNCPTNLNLIQFLEYLGLNPRLVAVEYNGEIRHRQFWQTTIVQANDRFEIVTIVGGG
ncbi:MAG: sulfur carrier protein ThiS [Prochlorotrichaceae cyanobacterium]|jgi:sulfur carrier protein